MGCSQYKEYCGELWMEEIERIKDLIKQVQINLSAFNNHCFVRSLAFNFNRKLTEEEIVSIEKENSVTFPEDYRVFLKELGNGGSSIIFTDDIFTLEEILERQDQDPDFGDKSFDECITLNNTRIKGYDDRRELVYYSNCLRKNVLIIGMMDITGIEYGIILNGKNKDHMVFFDDRGNLKVFERTFLNWLIDYFEMLSKDTVYEEYLEILGLPSRLGNK